MPGYMGACQDGAQGSGCSARVLHKIAGIQSRDDLVDQFVQRLFER